MCVLAIGRTRQIIASEIAKPGSTREKAWRSGCGHWSDLWNQGRRGKWYFHLKSVLAKYGIVESALERGCYRLVRNGELQMLIHSHVDDLLVALKIDSKIARETRAKVQKELHLQGGVKSCFEYFGPFSTRDGKGGANYHAQVGQICGAYLNCSRAEKAANGCSI